MDVRLTRDGVPVVIRDSRLLRLCGAEICVEDSTREELRNYFLSKTEERIPDLRGSAGTGGRSGAGAAGSET